MGYTSTTVFRFWTCNGKSCFSFRAVVRVDTPGPIYPSNFHIFSSVAEAFDLVGWKFDSFLLAVIFSTYFCLLNCNSPLIFESLSLHIETLTSAALNLQITILGGFVVHKNGWLLHSSEILTVGREGEAFTVISNLCQLLTSLHSSSIRLVNVLTTLAVCLQSSFIL